MSNLFWKIKIISFRTKLIFTVEFLVIAITLTCGFSVYNNTHKLIRNTTQEKLLTLATTTASVIDSDKIETIQAARDISSADYLKIEGTLKKIAQSDPDIASIYIMEKTDRDNIWKFIFDSDESTDENNNGILEVDELAADFGEEYDVSTFPEMQKAFEAAIVDEEISCDKWGCWLSGYAPLINENGVAIAIVGFDISAEKITNYEREAQFSLLIIFGIIATTFPLFLFFYLRYLLRPIPIITQSLEKFSGDLSTRININSHDEFGLIAESFNRMATELDDNVKNIESKIRARTAKISKQKKHIEAEKNKTESILKSIGDGVFVVDTNFVITMFNKQSEKISGFSAKETIRKKYYNVLKFVDATDTTRKNDIFIKKALISGETYEIPPHILLLSKDGIGVPIVGSISPIKNNQGTLTGCVIIFRNIT